MTHIDQLKIRRNGTGLRAYDPQQCLNGFTLFTPMNGAGTVYLIDMTGHVVHTWKLPHPPGLYGRLLPNGNLLYCGKIVEDLGRFQGWGRWKGGAIMEVDWSGNVCWELLHNDHHHDARKLRNGNILLLCLTKLPKEVAISVRGGISNTEAGGNIFGDYIVEMTTSGKTIWEWRSWEHLDILTDRITLQDRRSEWTHGNTVAEMDDGNILVSFRNISTVGIIDRTSGKLIWKLGPPPLAQQHDPSPLSNGNILIFDNGTHRVDHPVPYSRVIEVDPLSKQIVWSYQEKIPYSFFSPYISGAQRLENGNTLICEGNFGRIFEVNPEGNLVWEYISPYFEVPKDAPDEYPSNSVFRAFRYTASQLPTGFNS